MVRARSTAVGTGVGKAATLSTLPKGGSRRPSMQRPARRCQRSSPRRADEGRTQSRKRRADERTRTADLLITSALLAIWVPPEGLLTELRPYPPSAGTDATLNGGLVVTPTHRCRKRHIATPLFLRHAPLPVAESHPGSVRRET